MTPASMGGPAAASLEPSNESTWALHPGEEDEGERQAQTDVAHERLVPGQGEP